MIYSSIFFRLPGDRGNNTILFPIFTFWEPKKYRGIYQLILASLTRVSDALLNGISLISQKVLELS